ncbi:hypothetical protein [Paludibacter propionicigenes]|nr:hypothetical protein [Paludibacter propionicigenes]
MNKIKLGDIFEIETSIGKAYLHYIHRDKTIGDLVRVLSGLYTQRPESFDKIINHERYMIFFPLKAAFNQKIVLKVNSYPIDNYNIPKYMRTEYNVRGEFLGWHIIDTATWKRQLTRNLSKEQVGFSPWGMFNDTLLIEKLTTNWSLDEWA